MKIAAQTVLWGDRFEDLPGALDLLADHGCDGVEFCQRPDRLGDPSALHKMLADRGLTLLGLSGGTLDDRMAFCGKILRPEYLYVEGWDESDCPAATAAGFNLAFHPHLFKPRHRATDIEMLLQKHPTLRLLPDTVHLTIAGESPADVVAQWHNRVAAVHIKDWTPVYGRSPHRYARGFVQLGQGIVSFEILFDRLKTIAYNGWLVFEQGSPEASPEEVVAHSTRWLTERCRPRSAQKVRPSITQRLSLPSAPKIPAPRPTGPFTADEQTKFLETIFSAATASMRDWYPQLAEAIGVLLRAPLVLLCGCSPSANMMTILGAYPANTKLGKHYMSYMHSLSSVALDRQTVTDFDLTSKQPAARYNRPSAAFGYPDLILQHALKKLISVPVLNPQNPHQARLVLNVFQVENSHYLDPEDLTRLGRLIAQASDSALDERCAVAAASASFRAGQCQQVDAFLEELRDVILDALRCESLTIFLVNDAGNQLEEAKSTGLRWNVPRTEWFYRRGQGVVGRAWETREAELSLDPYSASGQKARSTETKSNSASPSLLCAPMIDVRGDVVGVIRCQSKRSEPGSFQMFSEDDLAVLDSICQTALPHLQVLLSKERRATALRRLTHELNTPIVAIRAAADRMKSELIRRYNTSQDFFSQDYVGDIEAWAGLMKGWLGNADIFRLIDRTLTLERRRVQLYADIFMPAVSQITELLVDRDFDAARISVSKFDEIPWLWLDKARFTQVVFNLLTNAIKYADQDPGKFRIRVSSRENTGQYLVDFSDWGCGVPAEMTGAIFLEGVRTKEAIQRDVSGDGLGLWVAQRVLKAHGGNLEVTNLRQPTTFTISLPQSLAFQKVTDSKLTL